MLEFPLWLEKLLQICMSNLPIAIIISILLHVTRITTKREFNKAKLFILIESIQGLILSIEDEMILKSG